MAQAPIDPKLAERIRRDLGAGLKFREIHRRHNVSLGTISNVKHGVGASAAKRQAPELTPEVLRRVLRDGPLTAEQLGAEFDCGASRIRKALAGMKSRGVMLLERGGRYDLAQGIHLEKRVVTLKSKDGVRRYGVVSDNHLCNKHSRLDVLRAAYDHFERVGITEVFNSGNWIDGEARFNKTELVTAPGMDSQLDYMIDNYPHRKGITTHYIAGDDHEGWYQQREGVEVGQYLQMRAEQQGRHDLKYLGYGEADIRLAHGSGEAVLRVVHPGGGSSYAISYTDQKRVESYQGGEKPHVEIAGHYHKFNYAYPREVHTLQAGCTCDQTMFMRKKRLQAMLGFADITIGQDRRGAVNRFAVEWFPFFDRGYYERSFSLARR